MVRNVLSPSAAAAQKVELTLVANKYVDDSCVKISNETDWTINCARNRNIVQRTPALILRLRSPILNKKYF